jgi:hypothetical protein
LGGVITVAGADLGGEMTAADAAAGGGVVRVQSGCHTDFSGEAT